MIRFGVRHPLVFTTLLFFAALMAAAVLSAVGIGAGVDADASGAIARIIVSLALLALFHRFFYWKQPLRGLPWGLPALCIALFNIALNVSAGMPLRGVSEWPYAALLSLAPALFEETIFRGIQIALLRFDGYPPRRALVYSALLFGAVHLTNIAGMSPVNVLIQTGYSIVIGLLLGAVYLKSGGMVPVLLAHWCIDFSYQLFAAHSETTSPLFLAIFVLILSAVTAYALWLVRTIPSL